MVGDQLVPALARENECGHGDGEGAGGLEEPAERAHDPALVEVPAGEEAVVVLVEIGLPSPRQHGAIHKLTKIPHKEDSQLTP